MKTMLDKCAVAGDITQAIDRRGAWSCAVTVIGGAENTAVKLQSADSADGEFTDFKTLISSDDAEADQYKGFVIDLSGAGNFIKVVGATMATCVLGDCDHDVKEVAITTGEIPSGADLEDNKEVSITENGTIEILPTEGKDGMKKVTATVNVPSSGVTAPFSVDVAGYDTIPIIIAPMNTQILGVFDDGNIIPYTDCFVQDPKTPLSSNTYYCPSNILSDPFDIYELNVAHGGMFYIPKNNVTGDPSAQELYEIAGDSFSLTKDTTITSGKTYYQLLPHENLEFAFSSLSRLYSVDINGSIQEI